MHEKADMQKKKERFMQTELNYILVKNGGHDPIGLGSRYDFCGQTGSGIVRRSFLQFTIFLDLITKACL